MEVLVLIDVLEDIIEGGFPIPFSGRSIVKTKELINMVQELRLKLPDELKQAKWIKEERNRILVEAQKEADEIIKGAENKISALVNEHEIAKKAYEQANEIITNAQKNARDIRLGTKEYADDILENLEKVMNETLEVLHNNRKELRK